MTARRSHRSKFAQTEHLTYQSLTDWGLMCKPGVRSTPEPAVLSEAGRCVLAGNRTAWVGTINFRWVASKQISQIESQSQYLSGKWQFDNFPKSCSPNTHTHLELRLWAASPRVLPTRHPDPTQHSHLFVITGVIFCLLTNAIVNLF